MSSALSQREQTLKQAYVQECPTSTLHVQLSIDARSAVVHSAYHSSLRLSSFVQAKTSTAEPRVAKHLPPLPVLSSLSLRLSTSLLSLRILQSTARIAVRCALHRQLAAPLIVAHAKTSIAECGARRLAKYRAWKHGLATSRASYAAARLGRCGKAPSSLSFSPSPSPSFPLRISPSPSLPLPLPYLPLLVVPRCCSPPRELHAPGAPRRPRSAERERERESGRGREREREGQGEGGEREREREARREREREAQRRRERERSAGAHHVSATMNAWCTHFTAAF